MGSFRLLSADVGFRHCWGEGDKFGWPEVKLGVIAGMVATQSVTKLIGRALRMKLHLMRQMMGANEA